MGNGFSIVVGDADGADKAVQKFLHESGYNEVTVFCSGAKPRNNLGNWKVRAVTPSGKKRDFSFYAAKDREMARDADFGLMIWNGESPGTLLNALRLIRLEKKAVVWNTLQEEFVNFNGEKSWSDFISKCDEKLRLSLQDRATADEWLPTQPQPSLFDTAEPPPPAIPPLLRPADTSDDLTTDINKALAEADSATFIAALKKMLQEVHPDQTTDEIDRISENDQLIDRSGKVEFPTVLKVINSMGLRLVLTKAS